MFHLFIPFFFVTIFHVFLTDYLKKNNTRAMFEARIEFCSTRIENCRFARKPVYIRDETCVIVGNNETCRSRYCRNSPTNTKVRSRRLASTDETSLQK